MPYDERDRRADQPDSRPRTYEGRPLPRPAEELVDQGLAFDVGTLVTRRRVLQVLGIGATGLGLAACTGSSRTDTTESSGRSSATASTGSTGSTEIPGETAGPFPGDGSNGPDVLHTSGVVRRDITSSIGDAHGTAVGVPMELELTLSDLGKGGAPFSGAAVYVWHCDRGGRYSLYSEGATDQNYLRGVQVADAAGTVRFTSIFPACYAGRWPHIHFEVYADAGGISDASTALVTSQVALPQDVCETVYATQGYETSLTNLGQVSLDTDNVFSDDGAAHQLATVTGGGTSGYTVSLPVAVDPSA